MFRDRVAICGGGLSSCSAASRLAANGIEVTIFEVGRGLGGRAATRRNGQTYFDHGAQAIRSPQSAVFKDVVDLWLLQGWIQQWPGQHRRLKLDYKSKNPTYETVSDMFVGVPHMNSICKNLANHPLISTSFGQKVTPKIYSEKGKIQWSIYSTQESNLLGNYDWVIGADRSIAGNALLDSTKSRESSIESSFLTFQDNFSKTIRDNFVSIPSLVLLIALKNPIPQEVFPLDSLEMLDCIPTSESSATIQWLCKDSSKPDRANNNQTWVIQSTTEFAASIIRAVDIEFEGQDVSFDTRKQRVNELAQPRLLQSFKETLLRECKSQTWQRSIEQFLSPENVLINVSHRWSSGFSSWKNNACPESIFADSHEYTTYGNRCSFVDPDTQFAACGDYLAPKSVKHGIEAAVLSGFAAAEGIIKLQG